MKRLWLILCLVLALSALLCTTALADGPVSGIRGVQVTVAPELGVGVDFAVQTKTGNALERDQDGLYADGVKLSLSVTGLSADGFYLILAQNAEDVPTEGNLVYIDQNSSAEGSVSFTVYPKELKSGATYYVYLTGAGLSGKTELLRFEYYVPYTLGNVNGDEYIDSSDALEVLKYAVGLTEFDDIQKLAGNVNGDEYLDSSDALLILKFAVGLITDF